MSDVTRLLDAIGKGDQSATAELLPLVYDEMRRLVRAKMSHERTDHALEPTALRQNHCRRRLTGTVELFNQNNSWT